MQKPPFSKNIAFVIGNATYTDPNIATLATPENDANLVAQTLEKQGFEVVKRLNATSGIMRILLQQMKSVCQSEDTRVVIYYAGHGIQQDKSTGLEGYLVPTDADILDSRSFIAMKELAATIKSLASRHVLLILDCCFAGTFNFLSTKMVGFDEDNEKMSSQYFDMYTQCQSRKVLTSSTARQKAFDKIDFDDSNSPFTKLLVKAISGAADEGDGDRLVTAPELYAYLQNQLPKQTQTAGNQQTAGLGSLEGDGDGEFIFFLDEEFQLEPKHYENPYKGLKSYEPQDASVFFGRQNAIKELQEKVSQHQFVVVTGASGTGKSSLVQAGLLPRMNKGKYKIIRPGKCPAQNLAAVGTHWDTLVIDQLEEVVTQAHDAQEVQAFFQQIHTLLETSLPAEKRIVVTVRADFEAQVSPEILKAYWKKGRFLVPAFTPEEYHAVIVQPARQVACLFEDARIVEEIKKEVNGESGPLPLLSFLMESLFERAKALPTKLRKILRKDYEEMGGLSGALTGQAEAVYAALSKIPEEQVLFQKILLRMVSFSAGEIAGKRVFKEDLDFGPAHTDTVKLIIKRLDDARLIRMSTVQTELETDGKKDAQTSAGLVDERAYLEPAHDALVRAWGRLWVWVKELGEENLLLFHKVLLDVSEYKLKDKEHQDSFLWHNNPRLNQLLLIVDSPISIFNNTEIDFIQKSKIKQRDEIRALTEERDEAKKDKVLAIEQEGLAKKAAQEAIVQEGLANKNLKWASVLSIIACIAFLVAINKKIDADTQRDKAEIQRGIAKDKLTEAIQNKIGEESAKVKQKMLDTDVYVNSGDTDFAMELCKESIKLMEGVKEKYKDEDYKFDTSNIYKNTIIEINEKYKKLELIKQQNVKK
jgi:energy-coupling factor transporter ATP-binding protein EcfA2